MASSKMIVTLMLIGLVALTVSGCSSDSNPVATQAIDTMPPAAPSGIDVAYSAGEAVITWAANTVDTDLAGYIVTRVHDDVSDALVATPAMINSYQDPAPVLGLSTYHVYAVDQVGNESAVATATLVLQLDHASGNGPEVQ